MRSRSKTASRQSTPARKTKCLSKKDPFTIASPSESVKKNKQAHWHAYHELQKEAKKAWKKLEKDVKHKAPRAVILRDRNHLALLLGECSYMTHECMNFESISKRR